MKIKQAFIVIMVLLLVMGLASCGDASTKAEDTKTGVFPGTADADTVTLDITSEPMEMNSILAYDAMAMSVLTHCVSGITRLDENDEPVADLADKWEINDDNTQYTINLKKDAQWSNGDSVTANDYYFAWVTQMKPKT